MSSWIKINDTAAEGLRSGSSNWPTQKSVAIMPVALGGFEAGTVFVGVTDNGNGQVSVRKFYYRTPGAVEFSYLTTCVPGDAEGYIKDDTMSFVISPDGMFLHAVTSWSSIDQLAQRIYYGKFNILTGEWSTPVTLDTTTYPVAAPMWPDIDIDQITGMKLIVVWTGCMVGSVYTQNQSHSSNGGNSWSPRYKNVIGVVSGVASSVFFDSVGNYAYLHKGISPTESTLHRNIYTLNLGNPLFQIAVPNMPNAACCVAPNGLFGLLDVDDNNDLIFACWDGVSLTTDPALETEMGENSNQYALAATGSNNDDGFWRAIYRQNTGTYGRVVMLSRRFNVAGWQSLGLQPYQCNGYSMLENQTQDYFGACSNFRHPLIDVNAIEIVTVSQTANGSRYDFYSMSFLETTPLAYAGYNIEVDLTTGAAKLRGMDGDKVLCITDWTRLSDDTVIFVNGSSVFQFDPTVFTYDGDLRALQWKQKLPTSGSRRRFMRVRCRYEYTDPSNANSFDVAITNEDGKGRTITFATNESDVWKQINVMGKEFFAQIDELSDDNIKIQQMDWEEWRDQDKI